MPGINLCIKSSLRIIVVPWVPHLCTLISLGYMSIILLMKSDCNHKFASFLIDNFLRGRDSALFISIFLLPTQHLACRSLSVNIWWLNQLVANSLSCITSGSSSNTMFPTNGSLPYEINSCSVCILGPSQCLTGDPFWKKNSNLIFPTKFKAHFL